MELSYGEEGELQEHYNKMSWKHPGCKKYNDQEDEV